MIRPTENTRFAWPLPRPSLLARHPGLIPALGPYLGALSRIGDLKLKLSAPQRQMVEEKHALTLARSVIWSGIIDEILDRFLQEKIPFIPVKGPVMAETYYPDPGGRPYDDLDFLVPENRLGAAEEILRSLGYSKFAPNHPRWNPPHTHHSIFRRPPGPAVELHFRLAHELSCIDGIDGFFSDASRATLNGRTVLALSDEDRLLYLFTHAATHGFMCGAFWALDVALVLARNCRLDSERIARHLEQRKLGPSGAAALRLAGGLFPSAARDGADLRDRLNRRIRCALVEEVVGSRWWVDSHAERSARSLAARAMLHQRVADLARAFTRKFRLNLAESLGLVPPP